MGKLGSKNQHVYLHEFIDIIGHNRGNYFEHMTAGWRKAAAERKQKTFGIWGTFGSTRRWPEVVNLWEYESLQHLAETFRHETSGKNMQDPTLHDWWMKAQEMRRSGVDRLLLPTDYSPSIDETIAMGVVGWPVFYHEVIMIAPGQAKTYLSMLEHEWLAPAKDLGLVMIGAYRTMMRNDDEVFLIWAIKDWMQWAEIEVAYEESDRVAAWRRKTQNIALRWENFLMCSAPLSPTQTGKQP
jgi:hypothetical protein